MRHIESFHLFEQEIKLPNKNKLSSDKTKVVKPTQRKLGKQPNIFLFSSEAEQVEFGVYKVISKLDTNGKSYAVNTKIDPTWFKRLSEQKQKAIEYYEGWLSKSDTKKKLKNPKSLEKIESVIYNSIIIGITEPLYEGGTSSKGATAFVFDDSTNHIFYFIRDSLQTSDSILKTLIHEIGHLIDFELKKLGEKTIYNSDHKCDGVKKFDNKKRDEYSSTTEYVESNTENYARLQVIRKVLNLNPIETPQSFIDKFFNKLQSRELKFQFTFSLNKLTPKTKLTWDGNENLTNFALIPIDNKSKIKIISASHWGNDFWDSKKEKNERVSFLCVYKGGTRIGDFGYLFSQYSEIRKEGLIINIDDICKINNEVVMNKPKPNEVNV